MNNSLMQVVSVLLCLGAICLFLSIKNADAPVVTILPNPIDLDITTSSTGTPLSDDSAQLLAENTQEATSKPTPPPTIKPTGSPFGHPEQFKIGNTKFFIDGMTATLTSIRDSRCQPETECIWSGELQSVFNIKGGSLTNESEIMLGSVRTRAISFGIYTFTLASSSASSTELIVTSNVILAPTGEISGRVTISPVCSTVTSTQSCRTPDNTYSSLSIVVYQEDNSIYTKKPLEKDGSYSLRLPTGSYKIQIDPSGIGAGEIKDVTVLAYQTVTTDFDIDSGIR
jgi:hypothetical protein